MARNRIKPSNGQTQSPAAPAKLTWELSPESAMIVAQCLELAMVTPSPAGQVGAVSERNRTILPVMESLTMLMKAHQQQHPVPTEVKKE